MARTNSKRPIYRCVLFAKFTRRNHPYMHIAEQITQQLKEGNLDTCLQLALDFLEERDESFYDECLLHKANLSDAGRRYRTRQITVKELELTRANIAGAFTDAILKKIRQLESNPTSTTAKQTAETTQTIRLNTVPAQPATPPVQQPDAAGGPDPLSAMALINQVLGILEKTGPQQAAGQLSSLLHDSLLNKGIVPPDFLQNNLAKACQNAHHYKIPAAIEHVKSTNRNAIGSLRNRDEGAEYLFTLQKKTADGSMPGMLRVFFSTKTGEQKITAISL